MNQTSEFHVSSYVAIIDQLLAGNRVRVPKRGFNLPSFRSCFRRELRKQMNSNPLMRELYSGKVLRAVCVLPKDGDSVPQWELVLVDKMPEPCYTIRVLPGQGN